MRNVLVIIPPTTATPMGRRLSAPAPKPIAIGKIPATVAKAVIIPIIALKHELDVVWALLLVGDLHLVPDVGHGEARVSDLLLDAGPIELPLGRLDIEYESPRLVVPVVVVAAVLDR